MFCAFILPRLADAATKPPVDRRFVIDYWQTEQGLPDNTVLDVAQASDGYLWLATWVGLVRFDGIDFEVIGKRGREEFSIRHVIKLHEDAEGALWVAADGGGVVRMKDGNSQSYSTEQGLFDDRATTICSTPDGSAWAATHGVLNRIQGGKITTYSLPGSQGQDHISDLCVDAEGRLWIASGRGLFRWDDSGIQQVPVAPDVDSSLIMTLEASRSGRIWIGGETTGVMYYENGAAHRFAEFPEHLLVWCILESRTGDVWFGTAEGLLLWKDGELSAITTEDGLSRNGVRSLFEDQEGNLWVGTGGGGLNRLKQRRVASHPRGESQTVSVIHEDRAGQLRVGVDCGGVYRMDAGGPVMEFPELWNEVSFNACVWALAETDDGSFWIGTWGGGLARIQKGRTTFYSQTNDFTHAVQAMRTAADGTLWLGTYSSGLFRFDADLDKPVPVHPSAGRPIQNITCLRDTRDGALWIGTGGDGLWRIEPGAGGELRQMTGVPSEISIRTLFEDSAGTLWAGTSGNGILQWDGKQLRALTEDHGLPDNVVGQCIEDDDGNLWWGSNRGIFRLRPEDLARWIASGEPLQPLTLGRADGMPAIQCTPAGLRTRDGKLRFGTTRGMVAIDPKNFPVNRVPPPVKLERVIADGRDLWTGVGFPGKVEIPPGTVSVEIRYSGLSYSQPEKVQFKYQLAGLERDWVNAGTRRMAYYTQLPPGQYEFRLVACNNDGVWNEEGVAMAIVALPQFWQTWWFRILVAGGLMAVAAGAVFLRISVLEREKAAQRLFARQLIDSQENERKRIAGELHDSLVQNLLVIRNQALLALDALDSSGPVTETVETISEVARAAVDETRAIAHNLRPYQLDRLGLTRALKTTVRSMAEAAALEYEADIEDVDGVFTKEFEINFYRIVQEGLNNVIKHAGASRLVVKVGLEPKRDRVHLVIRDDGKGFDAPRGTKPGFGLAGIMERVKIMSGELRITSSPGQGTRLDISLPRA